MAKILVIDDDNYLRGIYVAVFSDAGYEVFDAFDGKEGLESAKKNQPDLVFTGIVMPNMTGFDMMTAMKTDEQLKNIPVVVSSHLGRETDRVQAEELGAKAFIVKGRFSPKQVVQIVTDLLESKANDKKYRVLIDPYAFDGTQFRIDQEITGSMILEITPSLGKEHFRARLIKE